MLYLRALLGIIHKDLRLELRARETVGSILVIALVILVVFHFALGERGVESPALAAGVLWVALFFAAVLGQSRTFINEREGGCLVGLLLTPADRSAIYLAKAVVNWLFLVAVEVVLVPVFLVLYEPPLLSRPLDGLGVMAAATAGLSIVGTLVSSLALSSRNRELLLPILLFPLLIPVLIGAVEGTIALLPGNDGPPPWSWIRLLIGYDILFLAASLLLIDFALAE